MQIIIRVVIVLTVLSFLKINGQDNQEFDKKLTEYISIQNKRIGFNGVVLVANDKEVLYQKTIGYASHELQVPLAIDSKFKIASISKAFTGMLVAIAVQEGGIKLDDKIKPLGTASIEVPFSFAQKIKLKSLTVTVEGFLIL